MPETPQASAGAAKAAHAAIGPQPAAVRHVRDRLARAAAAPWLHAEVARRMAERLKVIRQPAQTWLDWGAFLGAGHGPVSAIWPGATRQIVEPTEALRRRSEPAPAPWWRWPRGSAVAQVLGEDQVPEGQAQMLWANLVWPMVDEPVAQLAQWHRALAEGGFLMMSTFGPHTLRSLRALYADRGWSAPHHMFEDMHDIGDRLLHAGFADPVMDQETVRLSWSTPQAALDELRMLGSNLARDRFAGLRTPRWHLRLLEAMEVLRGEDGRCALTFELVYGHAYKVAPRAARSDTAVISLERLRAGRGADPA